MINYKIKDKNTSLILCILGGWCGLHHFYNKQIGKGILYLFTFGLFYVGWIMDIVKIIKIKDDNIKSEKSLDRYCLKCGIKVDLNSSFCPNCGNNLNSFKTQNNFTVTFNYGGKYKDYETVESLYKKTKTRKMVNDYIVFDLETTGFDCKENKIIEIGALKYKNNELIDKFSVLINPQEHISSQITKITGITDEMVKDCETIDTVLPKFIEWIEDYTLIAHNGSFDLGFIEAKINELNLSMINNKNIDTLYLARKWIPDANNHKLETLKNYFELKYESHRALEDCYVTNYVYQYCKTQKEEESKVKEKV